MCIHNYYWFMERKKKNFLLSPITKFSLCSKISFIWFLFIRPFSCFLSGFISSIFFYSLTRSLSIGLIISLANVQLTVFHEYNLQSLLFLKKCFYSTHQRWKFIYIIDVYTAEILFGVFFFVGWYFRWSNCKILFIMSHLFSICDGMAQYNTDEN